YSGDRGSGGQWNVVLIGAESQGDECDFQALEQDALVRQREGVPVARRAAASVDSNTIASSCSALCPLARRMALRNHCSPKTSSSPPTNSRKPSSGMADNAGPSRATTAASVTIPAIMPVVADRQSRAVPA